MQNSFTLVFYAIVLIAVAGLVRMRYRQARETRQTRSSIPLRTYSDLWARLRVRAVWCGLPSLGFAIWFAMGRQQPGNAIITALAGMGIVIGGGIFDHCLLKAWARQAPPAPEAPESPEASPPLDSGDSSKSRES